MRTNKTNIAVTAFLFAVTICVPAADAKHKVPGQRSLPKKVAVAEDIGQTGVGQPGQKIDGRQLPKDNGQQVQKDDGQQGHP